ncbi:Phosphoadenosine phosphosulfate reductase family-domain-containing protein [Entophlyctis helioformis]|nr:Phosphoadenosine phosphosulfate reductase family-domain-containing protein [Entophlyctis helioformis]
MTPSPASPAALAPVDIAADAPQTLALLQATILPLQLPPASIFQTSALGPSGLVIAHLLASHRIPLIFIDTLYHFDETLDLLRHVQASNTVHVFKPLDCNSRADFEARYGNSLWTSDPDQYDYLVKAEPGRRAYETLNARIVITGRRRSQGAARAALPVFEWDTSFSPPLLKVNPLAQWGYEQVWSYIREHGVVYNALHDRGYKSVGDVHSTVATGDGGGERDGRWAGTAKTECGLHKDYFEMRAKFLAAQKKEATRETLDAPSAAPAAAAPE